MKSVLTVTAASEGSNAVRPVPNPTQSYPHVHGGFLLFIMGFGPSRPMQIHWIQLRFSNAIWCRCVKLRLHEGILKTHLILEVWQSDWEQYLIDDFSSHHVITDLWRQSMAERTPLLTGDDLARPAKHLPLKVRQWFNQASILIFTEIKLPRQKNPPFWS